MAQKLTQKEFINKVQNLYGEKFDISKIEYVNNKTKVCIVCKEHGDFWITPNNLLHGRGCPYCNHRGKAYTTEEWINKVKTKYPHNDYSETIYANRTTPIKFKCPKHGVIEQSPYLHLTSGCPLCSKETNNQKQRLSNDEFLNKAHHKFGSKYSYLNNYINAQTPITIQCNDCGNVFQLTPHAHLNKGRGCSVCNGGTSLTQEEFEKRLLDKHQNKFSLISPYKSLRTKSVFKCNDCGTEFERISLQILVQGSCPTCLQSSLEEKVSNLLKSKNINFIYNYRNQEWLGKLTLDFYLPEYNIAIECQGEQHFKPIDFFGGQEAFDKLVDRDKRKSRTL